MADTDKNATGARQLRIPLDFEAALERKDFIVTASNAEAATLVDHWPHWPHNVLALVGQPGTGKSHLSRAWAAKAGATIVGANELKQYDLASLATKTPVLVEDGDRMLASERALFHIFNLVREHKLTMILTCRERPANWPVALPDLISRLREATIAEIGLPDDALLTRVLVKLFADRQIQVDGAVIDYLVVRMERSMEAAHQLVEALDDEALTRNRGVTKGVARHVLAGYFEQK